MIFAEEESGQAPSDGFQSSANPGGGGNDNTTTNADDGYADYGDGYGGSEVLGEGIFGRKVIYRANVKKITEREGKMSMKLCVDRQGNVTYSEFLRDGSTIFDPNLVAKAEATAAKYRFEPDPTAPARQCGKLTFIFRIED